MGNSPAQCTAFAYPGLVEIRGEGRGYAGGTLRLVRRTASDSRLHNTGVRDPHRVVISKYCERTCLR